MTIRARTRIDDSGNLSVSVGPSNAGRVVDVTIRFSDDAGAAPVKRISEMSEEEYHEFLRRFIGSSPDFPDADGRLSGDHVKRAAARRV